MTEVDPADAERVEQSEFAQLVTVDAIRAVAGVINREAAGLPLADPRARQALNLAVDRDRLVREAMFGRAKPLAGLTPAAGILKLDRVLHPFSGPYPHDAERAAKLWRAAGGETPRPLRIAAMAKLERVARRVAEDVREALGLETEVTVYQGEEEREARRRLAAKDRPFAWDVFILEHQPQAAEAAALELHRAFVGATGEYRAGPVVPEFEERYAALVMETSPLKQAELSHRLDRFVHDEALALFLCAPEALYAVNKEVDFRPYRTTFELAETRVSERHWSRR